MKVVSGQVMQLMDQRAMREFDIPGLTLMENAGSCCADAISEAFGPGEGRRALVVAGKGNNGGDGYVIARLLRERGWDAWVLLLAHPSEISGDAASNLARLDKGCLILPPVGAPLPAEVFRGATLIIDALLGTGVKSEVTGAFREAIELINGSGLPVVAVDIPSGLDAGSGRVLGAAVRADLTVSFALAKIGNILYPGAELCGRLLVADIGMPPAVVAEAPGFEFVDLASARRMFRSSRGRPVKAAPPPWPPTAPCAPGPAW